MRQKTTQEMVILTTFAIETTPNYKSAVYPVDSNSHLWFDNC